MSQRKVNYTEEMIQAFMELPKNKDVAERLGIHIQTVAKYRRDPELQSLIRERRTELTKRAVNKMSGMIDNSLDKLNEIINDPETAAQTRVNAIQVLYSQYKAWIETTDIIERIENVEQDLRVNKNRKIS